MLNTLGDFIERPAGHKVILMLMIGFGVIVFKSGLNQLGESLVTAMSGALIYSMQATVKPPTTTVQTTTPTTNTNVTTGN